MYATYLLNKPGYPGNIRFHWDWFIILFFRSSFSLMDLFFSEEVKYNGWISRSNKACAARGDIFNSNKLILTKFSSSCESIDVIVLDCNLIVLFLLTSKIIPSYKLHHSYLYTYFRSCLMAAISHDFLVVYLSTSIIYLNIWKKKKIGKWTESHRI